MRSPETVYEMEGKRMLYEATPLMKNDLEDVDHTAVVAFIRSVQQEAYERGRKDGLAERTRPKASEEELALFEDLAGTGDYR